MKTERPFTKARNSSQALGRIRRHVAMAAYLYGPTHGRDLWNTLWDIAREVGSEEWVEELGDDPHGVCKKAGYLE